MSLSTTASSRGRRRAATDPYAAPALEKGLDILELLADEPDGLTQSQIAERLGRSHTEIFRMLLCLQRRGYLRRVSPAETFELTAKLFELSHRHPPTRSLIQSALPILQNLAEELQQSCHLAGPYEGQIVILATAENPAPRAFTVRLGARFDMDRTASGHVLLAWRPAEQLASFKPSDDLLNRLARVRRRGYEQQRSRTLRGVVDLSFPVRDAPGQVIAAMTVPFLLQRSDRADVIERARRKLARAAMQLSNQMGYAETSDA